MGLFVAKEEKKLQSMKKKDNMKLYGFASIYLKFQDTDGETTESN